MSRGHDIFSLLSLVMTLNPLAFLLLTRIDTTARSWDEALESVMYGAILMLATAALAAITVLVALIKLRWTRDRADYYWGGLLILALVPMYFLISFVHHSLGWPRDWASSIPRTVLCHLLVVAWMVAIWAIRRSWWRALDPRTGYLD